MVSLPRAGLELQHQTNPGMAKEEEKVRLFLIRASVIEILEEWTRNQEAARSRLNGDKAERRAFRTLRSLPLIGEVRAFLVR